MVLYIDTTINDLIEIGLKEKNKFIVKKKVISRRTQAEKLLPIIARMLKVSKFKLSDLKGIEVVNRGGSFTSLRVGIITANALGYALRIPVRGEKEMAQKVKNDRLGFIPVKPKYDSDPNITVKKRKH